MDWSVRMSARSSSAFWPFFFGCSRSRYCFRRLRKVYRVWLAAAATVAARDARSMNVVAATSAAEAALEYWQSC